MDKLDYQQDKDRLIVIPHGQLNLKAVEGYWDPVRRKIQSVRPSRVVIDGSDVTACDGAGVAFLLDLEQLQNSQNGAYALEGFNKDLRDLIGSGSLHCDVQQPARPPWFIAIGGDVGQAGYQLIRGVHRQIAFLGELCYRMAHVLVHPGQIRGGDLFLLAEKAGANGVGITSLLGFLIGLILAFQSAIALRMFGADVYVADLVVLCMFRELGPLITAFIVASRSGSAYAAELGTMKVNEELDALKTFGLDPVRFLIVPRVIALVLMTPLLTMFNNLFSLLGAQLVMSGLGFGASIFWEHVTSAAGLNDLFGGLVKTVMFGFLIGAIGCFEGMQTGKGASAVGDSATQAVVSCMVMLVAVDFVFAFVYYILGI